MVKVKQEGDELVASIYRIYEKRAEEKRKERPWSRRLGASAIGEECTRRPWYSFRWVSQSDYDGLMLRLFDDGHREEARVIAELREAGYEVVDRDDKGRQFWFTGYRGHFGGYCDGFIRGIPDAPNTWHVFDVKTLNDKRWKAFKKHGLEKTEPKDWFQIQSYMRGFEMDRGLVVGVNKNDSTLHVERIRPCKDTLAEIDRRCKTIVDSDTPPPRISDDPDYFTCRFCPHWMTCHGKGLPVAVQRNCRTCLSLEVLDDGEFRCAEGLDWHEIHQHDTTEGAMAKGCSQQLINPNLVSMKAVDACKGDDDERRWVRYQDDNGRHFIDQDREFRED